MTWLLYLVAGAYAAYVIGKRVVTVQKARREAEARRQRRALYETRVMRVPASREVTLEMAVFVEGNENATARGDGASHIGVRARVGVPSPRKIQAQTGNAQ